MDLETVQTPALILDTQILERNTQTMTARIQKRGCQLRPHMKTAKSIDIAQVALAGNFGGITVSTANEAEYFAAHGIHDILYAVCITPEKAFRLAKLIQQEVQLTVIVDNLEAARALNRVGERCRVVFPCMVEIDCGEHRTGVDPDGPELLDLAEFLYEASCTQMAGILTHAGHAYQFKGAEALSHIADEERRICLETANRLRLAGLPCPHISLGSTPTAVFASSSEGISETRAGVYMFGDVFQSQIGAHQLEDIALSVVASVISHNPRSGRLVLDAGGLALSKDQGTGKSGYGLLASLNGQLLPGLYVADIYQEHGEVAGLSAQDLDQYPIGSRLRVLPNHACMTAAMYPGYHLVEGSSLKIRGWWARTNGWDVHPGAGA